MNDHMRKTDRLAKTVSARSRSRSPHRRVPARPKWQNVAGDVNSPVQLERFSPLTSRPRPHSPWSQRTRALHPSRYAERLVGRHQRNHRSRKHALIRRQKRSREAGCVPRRAEQPASGKSQRSPIRAVVGLDLRIWIVRVGKMCDSSQRVAGRIDDDIAQRSKHWAGGLNRASRCTTGRAKTTSLQRRSCIRRNRTRPIRRCRGSRPCVSIELWSGGSAERKGS